MTEKRYFHDSWSGFSDEEVVENIEYLLNHYKDYELSRLDKDTVLIENVRVAKLKYLGQDVFFINKKFYPCDSRKYFMLESLFTKCKQEIAMNKEVNKIRKREDKRKQRRVWWKRYKEGIIAALSLGILVTCLLCVSAKKNRKEKQIDTKVKQYEKTLPNYQEYEQTKQKVANYRDSLERVGR